MGNCGGQHKYGVTTQLLSVTIPYNLYHSITLLKVILPTIRDFISHNSSIFCGIYHVLFQMCSVLQQFEKFGIPLLVSTPPNDDGKSS